MWAYSPNTDSRHACSSKWNPKQDLGGRGESTCRHCSEPVLIQMCWMNSQALHHHGLCTEKFSSEQSCIMAPSCVIHWYYDTCTDTFAQDDAECNKTLLAHLQDKEKWNKPHPPLALPGSHQQHSVSWQVYARPGVNTGCSTWRRGEPPTVWQNKARKMKTHWTRERGGELEGDSPAQPLLLSCRWWLQTSCFHQSGNLRFLQIASTLWTWNIGHFTIWQKHCSLRHAVHTLVLGVATFQWLFP